MVYVQYAPSVEKMHTGVNPLFPLTIQKLCKKMNSFTLKDWVQLTERWDIFSLLYVI